MILAFIAFISFVITFLIIPFWIKRTNEEGLTGRDVHKSSKVMIPEAGGITVLVGFGLSMLLFLWMNHLFLHIKVELTVILSILICILIAAFTGFIDDILGWKKGLNYSTKLIMVAFAAIPLLILDIQEHHFFGYQMSYFYTFLLIPIGIIGTTTSFNFIAGYNGLEASQGSLILFAMGLINLYNDTIWIAIICFTMVGALLAFLIFNWYPAKMFPGDVLTYTIGVTIGTVAILGDTIELGMFFFIPYGIETVFKLRGKLKKESFAKVDIYSTLNLPYKQIYSLTHLAIYILKKIKKTAREAEVVILINIFQIAFILIGLFLYFQF